MEKHSKEITQWVRGIALSDSQTASKSLYLTYFRRLMRLTPLHVPSSVEVEEVVSDTFLSLQNNRKSPPGVSNLDSYIYSIARHKAINLYRIQRMEKAQIDENTIDLFAHIDITPEEEPISKECIDYLNEATNTLPDKCKTAFELTREDKTKYKDAANVLEISVKALEARIVTAVRKLRESLAKEING